MAKRGRKSSASLAVAVTYRLPALTAPEYIGMGGDGQAYGKNQGMGFHVGGVLVGVSAKRHERKMKEF